MTYSIVARDPASGTLGVAVQSCFFCVGAVVPWARPGVAATTGAGCIDHAGHSTGDGFTVQANMMASPSVWAAMADAYTAATGPLPRRLLAALEAAQTAGGDARGVMSAALVVVGSTAGDGRLVDVRVDRSSDPLGDLARLLDAADAYDRFNRGVDKLFRGDAHAALADVDAGLGILPVEVCPDGSGDLFYACRWCSKDRAKSSTLSCGIGSPTSRPIRTPRSGWGSWTR
jgi:uncharacterized Ntn-hydrolase superfamily protein